MPPPSLWSICAIKSAPDPRVRFAGQSGHPSPRATPPGATGCPRQRRGLKHSLERGERALGAKKRGQGQPGVKESGGAGFNKSISEHGALVRTEAHLDRQLAFVLI